MKKSILVSMPAALAAMCFSVSVSAQGIDCDDLVWNAEVLASNPNIGDYCLEVVEKNGRTAARLHARVVRQSVNSTIVQWQHPDGSWSPSERRYPERGFTAHIGDEEVELTDLPARQEVNVYVPEANNWSVASAASAPAAPAAPAASPEPAAQPEPEPAPAMLPATASRLPLLALLGGLMILLAGAVGVLRSRL